LPAFREGVAAAHSDTRADIRQRLLEILAATLSPEPLATLVNDAIDATALLGHGIGLDSIEILVLVAAIEESFGITISDEDLDKAHFQSIGSLAMFIQEHLPS
jgi:acyl carrier protein